MQSDFVSFLWQLLAYYFVYLTVTLTSGVVRYLEGKLFRCETMQRQGRLAFWFAAFPFSLARPRWRDEWWEKSAIKEALDTFSQWREGQKYLKRHPHSHGRTP